MRKNVEHFHVKINTPLGAVAVSTRLHTRPDDPNDEPWFDAIFWHLPFRWSYASDESRREALLEQQDEGLQREKGGGRCTYLDHCYGGPNTYLTDEVLDPRHPEETVSRLQAYADAHVADVLALRVTATLCACCHGTGLQPDSGWLARWAARMTAGQKEEK